MSLNNIEDEFLVVVLIYAK